MARSEDAVVADTGLIVDKALEERDRIERAAIGEEEGRNRAAEHGIDENDLVAGRGEEDRHIIAAAREWTDDRIPGAEVGKIDRTDPAG